MLGCLNIVMYVVAEHVNDSDMFHCGRRIIDVELYIAVIATVCRVSV